MAYFAHRIFLATLAVALVAQEGLAATTVTISSTVKQKIPVTLWGQMFEDINSGDGGLYAELLQNRAFQKVTPGSSVSAWGVTSGASMAVVADSSPVSSSLPNSLALTVSSTASGEVGVYNTGYTGMKVTSSWTYTASFYYKFVTKPSATSLTATLSLRSTSGTVFGSTTATLSTASTGWTQVSVKITPTTSASSADNRFYVTLDGGVAKSAKINFAMFSLFPPTYKDRANGMRVDLGEALAATKPGVFRFPGGNNLEGGSASARWQWNTTVGSFLNRPGRQGDWGYVNTDGLGILEYLNFCEDVGMEPIMGVWDGYSLDSQAVAQAQLQPYIQQAIDQINFVIGDPSTSSAAALRSSLGHPEPFNLRYVEIGNEDFISSTASSSYSSYRWAAFRNALASAFPQLSFMATTYLNNPVLSPKPQVYDLHKYDNPANMGGSGVFQYDSVARDGTLFFEGEYAVISTASSDIYNNRMAYPTVQGAVAEAAYMTGMERNSDIVFAAAYAPLLGRNGGTQWTPNLITFDSQSVYLSPSYYVQQLFGQNRGDEVLTSTLPTNGGTLAWSVARWTSTSQVIIKVANTGSASQALTFTLPFSGVQTSGALTVLTGAASAANTPSAPNTVVPTTSTITTGASFGYTAPAYSFSVIIVGYGTSSGTTTALPTTTVLPTTTATTTVTPTTTAGGGGCTVALYGQCGGSSYTGCTTCASGSTCKYSNDYYSQCL